MSAGARDFGFTIGGKIGKVVLGILTQSLLAWNLGAAGRGSLAVCLIFSTSLIIIFSLACDNAVVYFVSSRRLSLSEGVIYTFLYGLLASGAAIGLGMIAINWPWAFFQQATPVEFKLALVLVPFYLLCTDLPRLFTAVYKFKLFAFISLGHSFFQLVFTVVFVWILRGAVRGALWASIASSAVIILASLFFFRRRCGLRWVCPVPAKMLALLKYGIRYYLAKVSNMANLQAGSVALAFFATRVEVGWFAVAARITQLVELLPDAMAAVLLPRSAGIRGGRSLLIARASRVIGVFCGVILAGLAIFAQPLVRIVLSPEFLPAVPFIRILALGLVIRCMSKVTVAYLLGTDHPGIGAAAVSVGVAANLAALWYFLPRVGAIGAPWGITISYGISSAIILTAFSRLSGLSLREIFTFRRSDWMELKKLPGLIAARAGRNRDAKGS